MYFGNETSGLNSEGGFNFGLSLLWMFTVLDYILFKKNCRTFLSIMVFKQVIFVVKQNNYKIGKLKLLKHG